MFPRLYGPIRERDRKAFEPDLHQLRGCAAAPILQQRIPGLPGTKPTGNPLPSGRKNPHGHNNPQFGAGHRNH